MRVNNAWKHNKNRVNYHIRPYSTCLNRSPFIVAKCNLIKLLIANYPNMKTKPSTFIPIKNKKTILDIFLKYLYTHLNKDYEIFVVAFDGPFTPTLLLIK